VQKQVDASPCQLFVDVVCAKASRYRYGCRAELELYELIGVVKYTPVVCAKASRYGFQAELELYGCRAEKIHHKSSNLRIIITLPRI
jgi:hypothetical protein